MDMVIADWKGSHKMRGDWASHVLGADYNPYQGRVIDALLARGARVDVAHDPEETASAFGWLCHEGGTIHYVYVRKMFRNEGVMTRLLEHAGLPADAVATHWTRTAMAMRVAKRIHWRYVPLWVGR